MKIIEEGPPGKQLKCGRQDDGRPRPSSLEANMPPWTPRSARHISVELWENMGTQWNTSKANGSMSIKWVCKVKLFHTQAPTTHQTYRGPQHPVVHVLTHPWTCLLPRHLHCHHSISWQTLQSFHRQRESKVTK